VWQAQLELEARVRTLERELDDRREREQELWLQFRNHRREIARLEAERADLVATLKQARDIAESLRVQLARANAMVMAATKAMDSHVAMSESIARETAQKVGGMLQQGPVHVCVSVSERPPGLAGKCLAAFMKTLPRICRLGS
jgi:chromosome segregation ATPase